MSTDKTLPDTGFVRLNSIIAPAGPIPVSKSTWWQGVKDGRFPKPGGARFRPGVPQVIQGGCYRLDDEIAENEKCLANLSFCLL
jgi:hypothetical protein